MKPTLAPGLARTERHRVDEARAIDFLGDGLRVYSTPDMVSDVEYACYRLVQAHLDAGESTVGAAIDLEHLGATPLGAEVEIRVEVKAVQGRRVTLTAEVHDGLELVGLGRHARFVVDIARFGERLGDKTRRLRGRDRS